MSHAEHEIERTADEPRPEHAVVQRKALEAYVPVEDDFDDDAVEDEDDEEEEAIAREASDDDEAEHRHQDAERDETDSGDAGDRNRGRRRRRRGRRDEPRAEGAVAEPVVAREPKPEEDEESAASRRRRRGRRGGRRMRDDSRPVDAFAWTRPWVPYGEDPFVWHDPAEDIRQAAPANPEREQPPERQQPSVADVTQTTTSDDTHDIWVELPALEEKPKSARSRRGRGRKSESEAVAETPVEVLVEPAPPEAPVAEVQTADETVIVEPIIETPAPKTPRGRRTKAVVAAETVAEIAPTPVPVVPPEPVTPPEPVVAVAKEPDPAEISAPPAAPRKGWWRRG